MNQLVRLTRNHVERLTSSVAQPEAHAIGNTCASRDSGDAGCLQILHDLNNVLGGMLINAQVMQWKLPAYSHSKRYVREIERAAQRGASLVKQLVSRLGTLEEEEGGACKEARDFAGAAVVVTAQEPNDKADAAAPRPLGATAHAAPVFSRRAMHRTHIAV